MKNQYFGDKRDLFKFDLLLDLMESGRFDRLSYVPMLTEPDRTGQGKLTRLVADGHRPELFDFLNEKRSSRDIRNWREFFAAEERFVYGPYRDSREDYSFECRDSYFQGVEAEALCGACIFIDPDIGIERPGMNKLHPSKYLFIDDLAGLLKRSQNSLILVYQHLQRNAGLRLGNIADHVRILSARLDLPAVPFIRDGDLAFYAIAGDEGLLRLAATTFYSQAEKRGRLTSHVEDVLHVAKKTLEPALGISDLAVFGSVARGEQGRHSDIDVMVSFDKPATPRGYFDVQHVLENSLGREIDLVTEKALRPEMRPSSSGMPFMQRDWRLFLADMDDCCRKLVDYRRLADRAEFDQHGMAFDAMVRNVEVLGHAAGKLPEQVRSVAPKVPWQAIIGLRHRIAHAYFGIDPDILWDVVEHEVPLLIEELRQLQARIGSGEFRFPRLGNENCASELRRGSMT